MLHYFVICSDPNFRLSLEVQASRATPDHHESRSRLFTLRFVLWETAAPVPVKRIFKCKLAQVKNFLFSAHVECLHVPLTCALPIVRLRRRHFGHSAPPYNWQRDLCDIVTFSVHYFCYFFRVPSISLGGGRGRPQPGCNAAPGES